MKTADLTGRALNWATAKALDISVTVDKLPGLAADVFYWDDESFQVQPYEPAIDSLIERERITLVAMPDGSWEAHDLSLRPHFHNATAREAVLRCIVSSRLGDEVELPKEFS